VQARILPPWLEEPVKAGIISRFTAGLIVIELCRPEHVNKAEVQLPEHLAPAWERLRLFEMESPSALTH
jgi:hypothetical protein